MNLPTVLNALESKLNHMEESVRLLQEIKYLSR